MQKRYQNKRASRKVVASQFYKNKSNRKISRKERDRELYKRTGDDTVRSSHNAKVYGSTLAAALPAADKNSKSETPSAEGYSIMQPSEEKETNESLAERRTADKKEYDILDELKRKGSKSLFQREEIPLHESSGSYDNIRERKKTDAISDLKKRESGNGSKRKSSRNVSMLDIENMRGIDKKEKIKNDLKSDLKKEEVFKNSKISIQKSDDLVREFKKEKTAENSQSNLTQSASKEHLHKSVHDSRIEQSSEDEEKLRKRKLVDAAYADYILYKKKQKKIQREYKNNRTWKNQKNNENKRKTSRLKGDTSQKENAKRRKSSKTKRRSRAVDPIIINGKRNLAMMKNEVKHMPVKSIRMVADDVSAEDMAMRAGRGIAGFLTGVYGNVMKSAAAIAKSIALIIAEVLKDILIILAPALGIGLILMFAIYIMFLSPFQLIMGGSGEEETVQQSDILNIYCRQALEDAAIELQQSILMNNPTANIRILDIDQSNVNDLYRIMSIEMALNGTYPDDEDWLVSTWGKSELDKYAGLMCHQMNEEEVAKYKENTTEETPTEEMGTQPPTEETMTEPTTERMAEEEIWIGYYSYEDLSDAGYLQEIEGFS